MTTAHEKPHTGIARRDVLALRDCRHRILCCNAAVCPDTADGGWKSTQSEAHGDRRTPPEWRAPHRHRPARSTEPDRCSDLQTHWVRPTMSSNTMRISGSLFSTAKGPDFSRGLDLPSWGAALAAGPLRQPPRFIDPLGTAGPVRSKPVVVAVQGQVTRVAHELFLAADVRVAAQDAVFNQGEVTAGSFPGGGATIRFTREAGWGNAMRYMLTGDEWHADDAHRMGLVQELTAPGQQLDRAMAVAQRSPQPRRSVSAQSSPRRTKRSATAKSWPWPHCSRNSVACSELKIDRNTSDRFRSIGRRFFSAGK